VESANERLPGGQFIFNRFMQFRSELPEICAMALTEMQELEYRSYLYFVNVWINRHPLPPEC
jgi:hypothetical protein